MHILLIACPAGLFVAMLVSTRLGHFWGRRRAALEGADGSNSAGMNGIIFALLGLLLAFGFSNAYNRLQTRRSMVVEETNQIGTAWLRLDVLDAPARKALQKEFSTYVESRLRFWDVLVDFSEADAELANAAAIQGQIWRQAVAAAGDRLGILVLPAINGMIDIVATRTAIMRAHPPMLIFLLFSLLAVISAWLAGAEMGKSQSPNLMQATAFAAAIALVTYLILDLEYPRVGLVQLDADHDVMRALLAQMRAAIAN